MSDDPARPSVPLGTLDLRTLQARTEVDEGDPVLQLDDGQVSADLDAGIGGDRSEAIAGAERLIGALHEFISLLRRVT